MRQFADAIVDCLRDVARFSLMQQHARAAAARFNMDGHLAALEGVFDELLSADR